MTERIKKLIELTLKGEMHVVPRNVDFSQYDKSSPDYVNEDVSRLCEYIIKQEPVINEYCSFTGRFNFDGSVIGDAFKRGGHANTFAALSKYYLKPIDNLSTMEWQHATASYFKVLENGIEGIKEEIALSLKLHTEPQEQEFLRGLNAVADAMIEWSELCSNKVSEFAKTIADPDVKQRLERLSSALLRVPRYKPECFYEAVLSIFVCFSADPDSVGTLDRFLTPFYERDIKSGVLTRDEAREYLQELFLMLQASTPISSVHFTRGGESHFCIGGYLPNGEDAFNELSALIVESLIELPTFIPQITLRWTKKLSSEAFRFVLDCERNDPHKRIAYTNDDKRIKCFTENCNIPFEDAVQYTMVGCNEPAFLGAITGSTSKGNILRCMETLFHSKSSLIVNANSYDEFYSLFENELFADLQQIYDYDDMYNAERAKDINYISCLFFNGCIENAKTLTQGGCNIAIASPMLIGITNLIDSLIIVKQFVFQEKFFSMQDLISALHSNWAGYEDMRTIILKRGCFWGNDDVLSNSVAQQLYQSLYNFLKGKKNLFGYQWLVGDLLGYNEHHKMFGEKTLATPDGRCNYDLIKFGIGQSEGKDREGLTALLNSIAKCDANAIACGSTITNLYLDKKLVSEQANFEKLADMLEIFFNQGGVHFQLTYASKDDLVSAKASPENYKSLRVRVTGFSDYFVKLKPSIQDDIICRTVHRS